MWRVLKFLLLVVLCIPAWIALQVAWEAYAPSPVPSQGARAAVDAKLKGETWRVVAMDPKAGANAWLLTGLVAVPGDKGDNGVMGVMGERVFLADMRSVCARFGDRKCWVVERLAYADAEDFGADEGVQAPVADEQGQVKAVQTALKMLGFDPGPVDGAVGAKTRTAIAQYRAQHLEQNLLAAASLDLDAGAEAAVAAPSADAVLVNLEAMGRQSMARTHQVNGDYHAALKGYAEVRALKPALPQPYFNSGVMYRSMGLPELAIDEYDVALANKPDWEVAYYERGNAYYQEKQYLSAYGSYADGLGVRVLGDRYFGLRERLVALGDDARVGADKLSLWAAETWQRTARLWRDMSSDDEAGQAADDPAQAPATAQGDVDV